MFGNIDIKDFLVIGVACAFLFGAKKLPMMGRSAGQAITEFKNAFSMKPEELSPKTEAPAGAAKSRDESNS